MAKKRKKKGRKLARRFGHSRRGHSYADGTASVPVQVHGTLYISPAPFAESIVEAIEESPQLMAAIVEEIAVEALPEEHDYWPAARLEG